MAFTPPFQATNPTGTAQLGDSVKTAFSLTANFALRSTPLYEMIADVRSTAQTHSGSGVQFTFYTDMAQATTALNESHDVTPVALSDSAITITLAEYGNAVLTTAKLRGTSFFNIDADAANIVGYNMADSMDKIVSDIAQGGTNVTHVGSANRGAIAAGNKYTASEGRKAVAQLRTRNAPGWENGNYMAVIHPNVSYDLRSDTAVTDVINYQLYQEGAPIKAGSIGTFNGIEYIENPRAGVVAGAGAGGIAVYQTLVVGRQFLAKAFSRAAGFGPDPQVVFGPVTDVLRRFNPVGWYHMAGYGIFRQDCGQRVESSSSLG
tara:strand:+ start:1111 stop:2070 length:960 start_codon:yes stop_codon:yes gene_type:complete